MYEKITSTLSKEDVIRLSEMIDEIFGRPVRKNEFYYRGFGVQLSKGKRKKGGGGDGQHAAEGGQDEEQQQEEQKKKTKFDVQLTSFDAKVKIKVIKEVRGILGLGLKESKELVESVPKILQKDMKEEDAEKMKQQLEALGAVVELL